MIRRVQLMVTCTTAMVECLVDANKTEQVMSSNHIGVKVLTSVSRVNISFAKTDADQVIDQEAVKSNARLQSKSFKNITMNNTIGLSVAAANVGKNLMRNFQAVSINDESIMKKGLEKSIPFLSRKMISKTTEAVGGNNTIAVVDELNKVALCVDNVAVAAATESENSKEVFRKVKLHSDSEGFRSPLKQINNQLTSSTKQSLHRNS